MMIGWCSIDLFENTGYRLSIGTFLEPPDTDTKAGSYKLASEELAYNAIFKFFIFLKSFVIIIYKPEHILAHIKVK